MMIAESEWRPAVRTKTVLTLVGLIGLAGCSAIKPPNASDIAGLPPDGTVMLNETFVTGLAEGSGTLNYQGQAYPFIVIGTVMGPGGGLDKIQAGGEVYKLQSVGGFPGRYTQGTGNAGLATSGAGDLWLGNSAGVVMHLRDVSAGAMLTLGRDEILIRMSQ
jgi:hypothetical protein